MKKKFQWNFVVLARLLFFLLAALPARSAIFSTIVTNGPTTNRINLVFFAEGYTNGQFANFLNDATNAANFFLGAEPYTEYSNYFNVFAIFTNSAHAGSTHLVPGSVPGAYTNGYTYFNSSYDSVSDFLITMPPNSVDTNASHGQVKINSLLWTNYFSILPNTNNDLPALLVNDVVEGGSDGGSTDYGKTAISSIAGVSYILVHESGHTLGGLGDEYTTANPQFPNVEEPNTTTNTNYLQIKWNAWIPTNTPIPTPLYTTYQDTVGLFQGAHYHTTGWYRPFENCCMQSYGETFCPVCQETLVLAIYRKVRPMDYRSPITNNLTVTSAQMLVFNLNLLIPATHSLNVEWRTNSVTVNGATNATFSIWPSQLGSGNQKVEADVWDATSLVRTDASNVLKQTNVWSVNVTLPAMQINTVKWLTNGSFTFQVTGTAPDGVVIQMSTNLKQWTAVQTNFFSSGKFLYTNTGAAAYPKLFYRTETPP